MEERASFVRDEVNRQADGDLIAEAAAEGIDVDSTIRENIREHDPHGDMKPATVARLTISSLKKQIEATNADDIRGIVIGNRDRFGKNWPRRYSVLRSSGDHVELSSFDPALQSAGGGEVRIPEAGIATFKAVYDDEYDSWEAKQIEDPKRLDAEGLRERLATVAVPPSGIGPGDEWEIAVVRGDIRWINPQTLFEDNEAVGDGPILMPDERGEERPHLEIALEEDGSTRLRGHLERQRYGRPHVDIPDFGVLVERAADRGSPDEQASFLQDALAGLDVILVGNVSSYDQSRREDRVVNYVDMALTAVVDMSGTEDEPVADEAGETAGPDEPEHARVVDEDEGERSVVDVRSDIEQYAELANMDIGDLTVELVKDKLNLDDPDSVIEHALRMDAADPQEAARTPSPGEEPDSWEAAVEEDGMYHCPGEECIYSAGSPAGLLGHASKHTGGDPEEWIREQVGL